MPQDPPCAACGIAGASLRCGRCKGVKYCTPFCQKRHWPAHKRRCKASTYRWSPRADGARRFAARRGRGRREIGAAAASPLTGAAPDGWREVRADASAPLRKALKDSFGPRVVALALARVGDALDDRDHFRECLAALPSLAACSLEELQVDGALLGALPPKVRALRVARGVAVARLADVAGFRFPRGDVLSRDGALPAAVSNRLNRVAVSVDDLCRVDAARRSTVFGATRWAELSHVALLGDDDAGDGGDDAFAGGPFASHLPAAELRRHLSLNGAARDERGGAVAGALADNCACLKTLDLSRHAAGPTFAGLQRLADELPLLTTLFLYAARADVLPVRDGLHVLH
ncbi:hypothetical protein JL722_10827 [Aureococcus anophagefferens]|nr:hypothetical protein JL722_10827 [Aureococcus anophagefferens]